MQPGDFNLLRKTNVANVGGKKNVDIPLNPGWLNRDPYIIGFLRFLGKIGEP